MGGAERPRIVVVGQIGRDLVLTLGELPDSGGSGVVRDRDELLGGKGANQAVAGRQLGADVALVGVIGDDAAGRAMIEQARRDGIDVGPVARRADARTALLVDVVAPPGERRLFEHIEDATLLTAADVEAVADALTSADAVLLQLQQPAEALLRAVELVSVTDALVVADGAPPTDEVREALLSANAVFRADAEEAELLTGTSSRGVDETRSAAVQLVERGARLVALAAGEDGDVVVWGDGHVVTPLLGDAPVDQTGAGDAAVAALTVALLRGESPRRAAWWAASAAAHTVAHTGGRPRLDRIDLVRRATEAEAEAAATAARTRDAS